MEIKAELLKPYTEDERINFIVTQNHQLGYEIRETETALEAWGYTEEEKQEQERERIDMLSLTRGDVFMGLIQARMIDENSILAMIETMPEETDEQKKAKMLAKNACQNALNFHRGHDLVNIIGQQLGISSENLDKFFEENDYHYLLPVEPEPTETEEQNDI